MLTTKDFLTMDYEQHPDKKLLESNRPCPLPECGSSNAFNIWQKGEVIDGHCFSCGRKSYDPYADIAKFEALEAENDVVGSKPFLSNNPAQQPDASVEGSSIKLTVEDGLSHPIRGLPERGLSYSTCEHFGVRIGVSPTDGNTPIYTLFPRTRDSNVIGFKKKTIDKQYINYGGNNVELFGANITKPSGKKIFITEGELDALALFQSLKENSTLSGYNPSVVSLSTGASSALKSLTLSDDLLNGYKEIVIVFDNDDAGQKAREEVCKAYAGKVSYVTIPYPYKDANDMVLAGKSNDLKWLALTGAKKYQPDGIVNASTLWEKYKDPKRGTYYPYPPSCPLLNEMMYGARPGTIITITSGSGCGKTQFMRELMYHYYLTTDEMIAGMFLEEDTSDTLGGLISLDLNKRITLPDVEVTDEEEKRSFDKLFGSDRISLYDYFGGMDDNSLLSKLRYFAITGHKFIFLDHLSIIVSEYAAEGGERERIDTLMTKLAKFVKEFGVILFLVVHLRKADSFSLPFEQGAVPSLDDLRGSAAIKQLSWDVIGLSRNQQHKNAYCANTTEATILKCRFTGRTGVADYLYFNDVTGRMQEVEKPQGYREAKRLRQA